MNRRVMRCVATFLVAGAALFVLGACGGGDGDGEPGPWDARSLQGTVEDLPFIPSVINSSLGVGDSRVVVALIDRTEGSLVADAAVTGTFYRLPENPDTDPNVAEEYTEPTRLTARTLDLDAESNAGSARSMDGHRPDDGTSWVVWNVEAQNGGGQDVMPAHEGHEHTLTTVYTTNVSFDRAGYWGLALRIEVGGETHHTQLKFWVTELQGEIPIGDPAPRSEQLTLRDVEDPAEISSATNPNPAMLEKTVAEALDTGRPVVVAFVTPSFCQTRYCGPVLESVVEPAWEKYGDRVEFIHIEPFDLDVARSQGALESVPAVEEWGLQTEPFIFVVDGDGMVRTKLEGVTDVAELSDAIENVLP